MRLCSSAALPRRVWLRHPAPQRAHGCPTRVPAITCPTVILHNTDDPIVPVIYGRRLAAGIPHSKYIDGPGREPCARDSGRTRRPGRRGRRVSHRSEAQLRARPDARHRLVHRHRRVHRARCFGRRSCVAGDVGAPPWRHHPPARPVPRRIIKSTGDGVLALFDGPSRAVRCAQAIVDRASSQGLSIPRACTRGRGNSSATMSPASRCTSPSESNRRLRRMKSWSRRPPRSAGRLGHSVRDRGEHALKGLTEPWHLYAVATA